jgi:hypothetical protein
MPIPYCIISSKNIIVSKSVKCCFVDFNNIANCPKMAIWPSRGPYTIAQQLCSAGTALISLNMGSLENLVSSYGNNALELGPWNMITRGPNFALARHVYFPHLLLQLFTDLLRALISISESTSRSKGSRVE